MIVGAGDATSTDAESAGGGLKAVSGWLVVAGSGFTGGESVEADGTGTGSSSKSLSSMMIERRA